MIGKKIPYRQFAAIYAKVPRLTVDLILLTNQGILLSKRDIPPAKGMWHIPGGTVLIGERHADTVKRVAKEELGIAVRIEKQLGVIEYGKIYSFGQTTSIVYQVSAISGEIRGSEQAKEVRFFKKIPKNTIPEQATFIKTRDLLEYPD